MGNTEAGQTSKTTRKKGKKPAFQLSQSPLIHGHARPDLPAAPSSEPSHASPLALPLEEGGPANAERPSPRRRAARGAKSSRPVKSAGGVPNSLPLGQSSAYEDLGPLPAHYGSQTLFLVARDPEWLFCYWDIDWEQRPGTPGSRVILRMFPDTGETVEAYSAEITPDARNWYIPASQLRAAHREMAGEEGSSVPARAPAYFAEIGYVTPNGEWDAIARSNAASLPAFGLSEETDERFATIPFHLAFQRIQEMLEQTSRRGEALAATLARLQQEGRHLMVALGRAPRWTPEQRHLLAALLGNELERLMNLKPEEVDALLREQLKAHLASSEGSLASLGGGVEGNAAAALAVGSPLRWEALEQLSSLTMAVDHGFWSSWLSSWQAGALSSYSSAIGGFSSGEMVAMPSLASWLSSWSGGGESSFLSSWPAAAEARESAFWSSWLSSWGGAAQGWSESSGGLSSFSIGSSWSGRPPAAAALPQERGFFMHVNAEVIFYGGTHPEAKLWVDGKPVPLRADGSFHFHFKLPDGGASVPIVAQSPDGREQRSATLHLSRSTERRGEVGATSQPPHLPTLGRTGSVAGDEEIPHGS